MNESEKTEWIDLFLDNALKDQEKAEFERRLEQDPAFRLEVESQKAVRRSLEAWGNHALKEKFKQFHERMPKEDEKKPSPLSETDTAPNTKVRTIWSRPAMWVMAASISLLVLAGIFWINREAGISPQDTTPTALQTFQIPVTASGGENMGYAGDASLSDSVVVQLFSDPQYSFHYRFKDTLQIFASAELQRHAWVLAYDEPTDTYVLEIDEERYPVERGGNRIRALQQE